MNYFELPDDMIKYVKDIDYKRYFDEDKLPENQRGYDHQMITLPHTELLTEEGILWFSDRNLKLREIACLFKLSRYTRTSVHIDAHAHHGQCLYAVNIVLSGEGEMQWFNEEEIKDYKCPTQELDGYGLEWIRFEEGKHRVVDRWRGKAALVSISSPHRVAGGKTERYAISLRTVTDIDEKSFEYAMNQIKKNSSTQ